MTRLIGGLRCAEVLELLPHYLEGELEPDSRTNVEEHVRGCPDCASFGQAYARLVDELKGGLPPAPQVGSDFLDRLRDSIPLK